MKKSRLASLIIIVPLLAMAAGSVAFLIKVGLQLKRSLPNVLKQAASERIDGSVEFGRIGFTSSGVKIHDLRVADASGKPVVMIPAAEIDCDLGSVIRGDAIGSIRSANLLKPRIFLERRPDGRWNVEGLIKPMPAGKPLKFSGIIRIESGRVIVRDRLAKLKQPMENSFSDLDAFIDLSNMPVAKYVVSGKGPAGRLGKFEAKGRYNLAARSLNADLDVLNANASYWMRYPADIGLDILSGRADGAVKLVKAGKDRPLSYSSAVKLCDASIRFKPIRSPVKDLEGDVTVGPDIVSMKLKGRLESSPFLVSGDVRDFESPLLALDVAFDWINLREVIGLTSWSPYFKEASIPRDGRLTAYISGPPKDFTVDFALEAPSLAYKGYGGRSVVAIGRYSDQRIRFEKATAVMYGGHIQASGSIDFAKGTQASFAGEAKGLQSAEVPFLTSEGLVLSSDGAFSFTAGKGLMALDYQGSMDGMRFGGLEFDKARIDCSYAGGTVRINEFSAETLGGTVSASGSVGTGGALDLDAWGLDINLAELLKSRRGTVGRAHFAGRITGNVKSPVFEGEVGAERVMVSEVGIERISGKAYASRDRISLTNMVFHDYPGALIISGTVSNPLAESPDLNFSVAADSLDIGRLPGVDGPFSPESGMLFGDLTISGTSSSPRVQGNLHVRGASYDGTALDTLMARFSYEDDKFQVEDFRIKSGDSLVTAIGAFEKDGNISAEFQGDRLALDKFSSLFMPYATVGGSISLKGSVAGRMNEPRASIELASDNLKINGQTFTELLAKASMDRNAFMLSDVSLSAGKSSYSIPKLAYDAKAKSIEADLQIKDGSASQILALLDNSPAISSRLKKIPRPLAGLVNASISGSIGRDGEKAVPDLHVEMALDDMQFGGGKAKSVRLAGNWQGDIAKLEKLEAIEGDTNLSAEGTFGPGEALTFQVDARNLSMDTVRQWVRLPDNFSGNADVTVVAGGSRSSLTSEAYVEIVDPVIGGAKFDRLRSRLTANKPDENGRITIKDLTLTLDNHDLRVTGYVPVDWTKPAIPKDSPISLEAGLDNDALAILSAFSKVGLETGKDGRFEGLIKLGGTVNEPGFSGSIVWEKGEIRLPRVVTPFTGIDARMTLSGDRLAVEQFHGNSAEGGTFDITGGIAFADLKPTLDLGLKTASLRISSKDLSGSYGESVKTIVDGDVRATEGWRQPLISGSASIYEGLVDIPSRAPKAHEPRDHSINPRFDLRLLLGRKVRLNMATLKTPLIGTVAIAGSLSQPVINGLLDMSDGTIIFPMRQFRILPGSTLAVQPGLSQRPAVEVDLRAETKLTVSTTFRRRERYTITLLAQGPMDRLRTKFDCSPPGLSEIQMVALLTGQSQLQSILRGEESANLGMGLSSLFSTAIMPTFFAPIEEAFKTSLGVEEFALEAGYKEPIQLTIGDRLLDRLYLDYSTILGSRPDYADSLYELTLSYRFRHGMELEIQTDENRTYSIGVVGRLRF